MNKEHSWFDFFGVLFLLIGIYATAHTLFNIYALPKYPQSGVLSLPIFASYTPSYGREQDCTYPRVYYDPEGKLRSANTEEKIQEEKEQGNCLSGITESREAARQNDIHQSAFFLFLGVGLLFGRKYLLR